MRTTEARLALTEFLWARIAEEQDGHDRMKAALEDEGSPDFTDLARIECQSRLELVAYAELMARHDYDPLKTRTGDAVAILRFLAAHYVRHPDYRQEWKR